MRDIATKADNVGNVLSAEDFNATQLDLETAVISAGIALDPAGGPDVNTDMIAKAMSLYSCAGDVFVDSGAADAYVLTISGTLKNPPSYYSGMRITFKVTNTNTGASTVNLASLGVKSIVQADGSTALSAGDLTVDKYYTIIYNSVSGKFEIFVLEVPSSAVGVSFTATNSTAQLTLVTNYAKVGVDTEDFDIGGHFDATTNYRFTAPVAGRYLFTGTIKLTNITAGNQGILYAKVNGTTYYLIAYERVSTGSVFLNPSGSTILNLSASDYVEFWAWSNDASYDIQLGGSFSGILQVY